MRRFIVRVLGGIAIAVAASSAATAQIARRPAVTRPINWAGVSVGLVQGYLIDDGTTEASWEFGSALEYAARIEHPTKSGVSIGAQASYSKVPLTYSSATCASCNANVSVRTIQGLLHFGGGYSFHPVYELAAGVVGFSNFRRADDSSVQLGVNTTDYDFKLSIGYGLGFGLSPSSSIEVVQELGTILHQRDNLPGGASNYPRVIITRIGGKISF